MYYSLSVITNDLPKPQSLYVSGFRYNTSTRTASGISFTRLYHLSWLRLNVNELNAIVAAIELSGNFKPVYQYQDCIKPSLDPNERIYRTIDRYVSVESSEELPAALSVHIWITAPIPASAPDPNEMLGEKFITEGADILGADPAPSRSRSVEL